jgi:hypothetical protein
VSEVHRYMYLVPHLGGYALGTESDIDAYTDQPIYISNHHLGYIVSARVIETLELASMSGRQCQAHVK